MKRVFVLALLCGILAGFTGIAATAAAVADPSMVWEAHAQKGSTILHSVYTETLDDGLIDQLLVVEVEGGLPDLTVFVTLNDRVIGRMETDDEGGGEFVIEREGVEPDAQGRPDGPRIEEGDIIRLFIGIHFIEADFVLMQ